MIRKHYRFYATVTYIRHFMKTAWFQNNPVHLANMEGGENWKWIHTNDNDFPDRYTQTIKW